jgi:hypothetical protein
VEGAAIRAGAGVQRGLADIAALATSAAHTDRAIARRVHRSHLATSAAATPLLAAIAQARTGPLPRLLRASLAAGRDQPALLHDLNPAPVTGRPVSAIATVADASTALASAQTWIWQHPDQLQVSHLQAATRLGLAVTAATHDATSPARARAPWRSATIAAHDLRGSPPGHDTHPVLDALRDLTAWITAHSAHAVTGLAPLAGELAALAHALDAGLHHAVARGDVFVRHHRLTGNSRHLIVHAATTWRPAIQADENIAIIRQALRDAAAPHAADRPTGSARLAFTQPLRLIGATTQVHPDPHPPGPGPTHRRSR